MNRDRQFYYYIYLFISYLLTLLTNTVIDREQTGRSAGVGTYKLNTLQRNPINDFVIYGLLFRCLHYFPGGDRN